MSKHDMAKIYDSMYKENERYSRMYNMTSSAPEIPINIYQSQAKRTFCPEYPFTPKEVAKDKI